jgi:hypothetical protein
MNLSELYLDNQGRLCTVTSNNIKLLCFSLIQLTGGIFFRFCVEEEEY